MQNQTIKDVQFKILEIMKYIDALCRRNGIVYYIMGGTALGAVRHGGFIPWDDDLDIFMTPDQYGKFKEAFDADRDALFVLQEWRTTPAYVEYAKVRMNGTTFIEENYKNRKDLHQGIYVDIMMLHKVPLSRVTQKIVYCKSKYVTLYALSQRNWKPKDAKGKIAMRLLRFLPNKMLQKLSYKHIYQYDSLQKDFLYCYWITKAGFKQGLFSADFFSQPVDIPFENTTLLSPGKIKDYLRYRYGDYMKLPSDQERKAAVHAAIYDTSKDYRMYLNERQAE